MDKLFKRQQLSTNRSLEICQGDITLEQVDAIVNAANSHLAHGGGVAGVIARKGGSTIQRESDDWVRQHGPVSHDKPAYTSGGKLPCKYVIHAVGPIWGAGDENNKLAAAITGSLVVANELKLTSIAFPAISTGIFGFPKDLAASIFMQAIPQYFSDHPTSTVTLVKIVLFDSSTLQVFLKAYESAFGKD